MDDELQSGNIGSDPSVPPRAAVTGIEQALAASLRLVLVPVVILVFAAFGAFVYGAVVFVHSVSSIVRHPIPVGHQIGLFLLDIDLFLIGATLLISAVGFYELFIREIQLGDATQMPTWLEMHDLNDLKGRVVAMLVMVLSVSFVEVVVDAPSGRNVLELGGGIGAIIVALTVFQRLGNHGNENS